MVAIEVGVAQALAWRARRHLLDPVGDLPVPDVVQRLTAVPTMDPVRAELAVRTRRRDSAAGELAAAVDAGDLVQVFAFRGAVHVLATADAGAYLALRCAGRQWELASWREHYRLEPDDWPPLLAAVRDALADGPLTLPELGAAVTGHRRFAHLRATFDDGAGTLMKPLFWQGAMSFGPRRDGQPTFRRLDDVPGWTGVWDLADAGPHGVTAYLDAYGPVPVEGLHHWLGSGLSAGRRRIDRWLAGLGERVVEVDVDGRPMLVLAEHVDGLGAAEPSTTVRLLPGHDAWVMGPGTTDTDVVPAVLRSEVTRKADLLLVGGVVAGTWRVAGEDVVVTWAAPGPPPVEAVEAEVARLGAMLDRSLGLRLDEGHSPPSSGGRRPS